jgi:uncharacterized membrane protein (UPF0136 family)
VFEIAKMFVAGLAVLCLLGGIMGFVKAKSKASIIAGSISAVLLAACYCLATVHVKTGLSAAAVVGALLEFHFIKSYVKSKKPMPAIPMVVSCLITQAVIVAAIVMRH